jgi:hypothetical protein
MRPELVRAGLILATSVAVGCSAAPGASLPRPSASAPSSSVVVVSASPASTPGTSVDPVGSIGPSASPEPVLLTTTGTTDATATAAGMSFTATAGGSATCASRPDQVVVGAMTALDLGTLGTGTLRAQWQVPAAGSTATTIEAFIDGADLEDGAFQPFWSGSGRVTAAAPDGRSGTLAFGPLAIEPDPALKPGQTGPADAAAWPDALSGTISWTCAPWPIAIASEAPPASVTP